MVRELKTNTAVIVTVGPFYDKTDGVTIENSLTITNEKITLTADTDDGNAPTIILDNVTGATSGTSNDLNYISNCDAGLMQLEISAANVNRLGRMFLTITDAANHVPVFHEFEVVSAQYYDAKYGTGNFSADVKAISGDATAADNCEAAFDGNTYNVGGGAVVAASVTTKTGYALTSAYDAAKTAASQSSLDAVDTMVGIIYTVVGNLDSAMELDGINVYRFTANALEQVAGAKMDLVDAPNATGLAAVADAILKRDWSSVSGEASRSMLNALRILRNKFSISTGTLTVCKENDSTTAWTAAVTGTSGADPITAVDPAGPD